jgi:hypothetical protein
LVTFITHRLFGNSKTNNLKVDGWAKKLKEELEKIYLAYIWQRESEINVNICKIIRER